MANVLKISDAASLALHTMVILATKKENLTTAKEAASLLYVSEAHLSKVLQRLAKQGLVQSVRGPGGGFRLAKEPDEISLLSIYEAIEGPLIEDQCLLDMKACTRDSCIMGGIIASVNRQIREYLVKTNIAQLVE
jgi:Rrf2 family protein